MVEILERADVSPHPLYEMALGFAATKTLLAAHRLGLFEALRDVGKTANEVAMQLHLPLRTTEMLLNTCVALHLCKKSGAAYTNEPLAARYLVAGQRGYLGRFLEHFNDHMYPTWFHLEEGVKTGHAQVARVMGDQGDHFFQAIDRAPANLETFMETMEEHSLLEGKALAQSYDFKNHRELLDVAGGTGAMSVSILEQFPHLRACVFDRPPVCEIAKRFIELHGMSEAIQTHAGDFFQDPLPTHPDVILLSGILHNWSPENVRVILSRCREALPPGGTLLISEQLLQDDKTGPLPALLCSLNMLLMMEGAQEYSREEYDRFLSQEGFRLESVRPTGGIRQLLVARRL